MTAVDRLLAYYGGYRITAAAATNNRSTAATTLVDRVNSKPPTASSSDQCDDILKANHESAQRFMEDMELSVLNQDHTQISNLTFKLKVRFVL